MTRFAKILKRHGGKVLLLFACLQLSAENEPTWAQPDFRALFNGTFSFHPDTEPTIEREEQTILKNLPDDLDSQLSNAIQTLEQAVNDKSSPAIRFYLGGMYLRNDQPFKAEQVFLKAIEAFPSFQRAWQSLAVARIEQGKLKEAIEPLEKAMQLGGNNALLYGMMGYLYLMQDQPRAALTAYENAHLRDGSSLQWQRGMLHCLFQLQRYAEALTLIEHLKKQTNDPFDLLTLSARIQYNLQDYEGAIATYELAALHHPLAPNDRNLLRQLYEHQGAFQPYVNWTLLALNDISQPADSEDMLHAVDVLIRNHQWDLAETVAEATQQRMQLDEASGQELVLKIAQIHLATGRESTALAQLKSLLETNPLQTDIALILAQHALKNGELDQAEKFFHLAKTDPKQAYVSRVGLAKICLTSQRNTEALLHLKEAYQLRPSVKLQNYIELIKNHIHLNHE